MFGDAAPAPLGLPAPPRMHFQLLPAFNAGTPQPWFPLGLATVVRGHERETELPGVTALNVMGVFVRDVKRLTLMTFLRGQEADGSSSPPAAGTPARLSHYSGSPSPTVSLSQVSGIHGQLQPTDACAVPHPLPHATRALGHLWSAQEGPVRGSEAC